MLFCACYSGEGGGATGKTRARSRQRLVRRIYSEGFWGARKKEKSTTDDGGVRRSGRSIVVLTNQRVPHKAEGHW
jgi:hypothetical protein